MDKRGQKKTFVKSCSLTLILPLLIFHLSGQPRRKVCNKKRKRKEKSAMNNLKPPLAEHKSQFSYQYGRCDALRIESKPIQPAGYLGTKTKGH
jgi:hypothetical protein